MTTCHHCRQPITWAQHRGHWIPLNPQPHPQGRFIKTGTTYQHLVGIKLEKAHTWRWNTYQPHNCPARRVEGVEQ